MINKLLAKIKSYTKPEAKEQRKKNQERKTAETKVKEQNKTKAAADPILQAKKIKRLSGLYVMVLSIACVLVVVGMVYRFSIYMGKAISPQYIIQAVTGKEVLPGDLMTQEEMAEKLKALLGIKDKPQEEADEKDAPNNQTDPKPKTLPREGLALEDHIKEYKINDAAIASQQSQWQSQYIPGTGHKF